MSNQAYRSQQIQGSFKNQIIFLTLIRSRVPLNKAKFSRINQMIKILSRIKLPRIIKFLVLKEVFSNWDTLILQIRSMTRISMRWGSLSPNILGMIHWTTSVVRHLKIKPMKRIINLEWWHLKLHLLIQGFFKNYWIRFKKLDKCRLNTRNSLSKWGKFIWGDKPFSCSLIWWINARSIWRRGTIPYLNLMKMLETCCSMASIACRNSTSHKWIR